MMSNLMLSTTIISNFSLQLLVIWIFVFIFPFISISLPNFFAPITSNFSCEYFCLILPKIDLLIKEQLAPVSHKVTVGIPLSWALFLRSKNMNMFEGADRYRRVTTEGHSSSARLPNPPDWDLFHTRLFLGLSRTLLYINFNSLIAW